MATLMRYIMNPALAEENAGFPNAPEDWSWDEVENSASEQGISLTEDHWLAIRALQEYFARHRDKTPNVREIHDALDERFHRQGGIKYLYALFPGGPVAQGCRLAGIKAPGSAIDQSFGSVQ